MAQKYPPGTVAVARIFGTPDIRVVRSSGLGWVSTVEVSGFYSHADGVVTDIRPLIVLDPEDIGRPEALIADLRRIQWDHVAADIEEQLRPVEPTGLGAVVEVDGGVRFVRLPDGMWTSEDESQPWHHLNVVRVLSEGVSA